MTSKADPNSKGKNVVVGTKRTASQDDGGEWCLPSKKNQSGNSSGQSLDSWVSTGQGGSNLNSGGNVDNAYWEDDDSDDILSSDGCDSDVSHQSHGTPKKRKMAIEKFFCGINSLSVQQLNEPSRQWHCLVCVGGKGAMDWFKLQPLLSHAKNKREHLKSHREFAELLNKEIEIRRASVVQSSRADGQWKGLGEEEKDYKIVWPPMVIIMNTNLRKGDDGKWTGMGNQELMDYFKKFPAVKAHHSYGPQGHRGMGVLIFKSNALGYLEAELLHKELVDEGLDRNAWEREQQRTVPSGGVRQLFGFLATKQDMDVFNQHQGKTSQKFEMKSYKEMVVKELRQISKENQELKESLKIYGRRGSGN